jgi:hypothetical protein
MSTTSIYFFGNKGCGKSTLCDILSNKTHFNAGTPTTVAKVDVVNFNAGTPTTVGKVTATNFDLSKEAILFDTVPILENNAENLKNMLSQGGEYILVFVVNWNLHNNDDRAMIRIVLNALKDVKNVTFGIVINNVDSSIHEEYKKNGYRFRSHLNLCLPVKTDQFFCLGSNATHQEKQNFREFVFKLKPIKIDSSKVGNINMVNFETVAQTCALLDSIEKNYPGFIRRNFRLRYAPNDLVEVEREAREYMQTLCDTKTVLDSSILNDLIERNTKCWKDCKEFERKANTFFLGETDYPERPIAETAKKPNILEQPKSYQSMNPNKLTFDTFPTAVQHVNAHTFAPTDIQIANSTRIRDIYKNPNVYKYSPIDLDKQIEKINNEPLRNQEKNDRS